MAHPIDRKIKWFSNVRSKRLGRDDSKPKLLEESDISDLSVLEL